jgi:hypothetical protein
MTKGSIAAASAAKNVQTKTQNVNRSRHFLASALLLEPFHHFLSIVL